MMYSSCARNVLFNSTVRNNCIRNILPVKWFQHAHVQIPCSFNRGQVVKFSNGHFSRQFTARSDSGQYTTVRHISKRAAQETKHKRTVTIYICAAGVFMLGMSYAGVPLYRMFCQATGLGGQAVQGHDTEKVEKMTAVKDRTLNIRFNADVSSSMKWNFRPLQTDIKVLPGETALAFYTATNPSDKPVIGISTYNVIPAEAGLYFNKIQCFCFEEQRLNPHEKVDMPVFFYIDPEFVEDPKLQNVDTIILSYTFFEAKEGMKLPVPNFMAA